MQNNTIFINSGNLSSRLFFIAKQIFNIFLNKKDLKYRDLINKNLNYLILAEDIKIVKKSVNILDFYFKILAKENKLDINELNLNISSILDLNTDKEVIKLLSNNSKILIIPYSLMYSNFDRYKTFNITKNMQDLDINSLINKLWEIWYVFDNNLSLEYSYRKNWDILSFVNNDSNFIYNISFFGEKIDEINILNSLEWVISKLEECNIFELKNSFKDENNINYKNNKNTCSLVNKVLNFGSLGNRDISSFLNLKVLKDYNIYLLGLDFLCDTDLLLNKLNNTFSFSCIINEDYLDMITQGKAYSSWNNLNIKDNKIKCADTKSIKIINLEIEDLTWNFSTVTLEEWFLDKRFNTINILTKNKKVIKDFLEIKKINNKNIKIYSDIKDTKNKKAEYSKKDKEIFNIKIPSRIESFVCNNIEIFITDLVLSDIFVKKRIKRKISIDLDLLLKLKEDDFVVHLHHWIWQYKWLIKKELSWIIREYLQINYEDNKLFVPIEEIARLTRYVWTNPKLSKLKSKAWLKTLSETDKDIEAIAEELLDIYASRNLKKWFKLKSFKELEDKFKQGFEYKYTKDQESCITWLWEELEKEEPLDALLAWDVWFGKTEVATALSFKTIINKKQVAFIAPLVILALEHYDSIKKRLLDYWIRTAVITRLNTVSEIKDIKRNLKLWNIDIIIWTHRLLSDDIEFRDLWLVIIDEEHRFWVKHKDSIKKYRSSVNILSMSATPIPRSLNMALSWLRKIFMLKTPPIWRQSINTIVSEKNDIIVYNSIKRELDRWWQVLFLHNRILSLDLTKKYIEELFKNYKANKIKITIINWQMNPKELEQNLIDFREWKYNILLSTTVIENWVNFLNANTIIIDNAEQYWLSTLHQLRWRVWRWNTKWYCVVLYNKQKLKADSEKRLTSIANNNHLWAWFEIALHDLEIRWAWELLWIEQSWNKNRVWITLFLKLLEERVEALKSGKKLRIIETKVTLPISTYINDEIFGSVDDKIQFYREIESAENVLELKEIFTNLKDSLNDSLENENILNNLFIIRKTEISLKKYLIDKVKLVSWKYVIEFAIQAKKEDLKNFFEKVDINNKWAIKTLHKIEYNKFDFKNHISFLEFLNKRNIKKVTK